MEDDEPAGLSPTDEFANFEKWDQANLAGVPKKPGMIEREYARRALEEGLKLEELKVPGFRRPFFGSETRPLCVEARGFALGALPTGKSARAPARVDRTVEFDLPRGAYATVLLRALGQ
jgi:tRNA(Glu) U13 pseudouridine synthase TruD